MEDVLRDSGADLSRVSEADWGRVYGLADGSTEPELQRLAVLALCRHRLGDAAARMIIVSALDRRDDQGRAEIVAQAINGGAGAADFFEEVCRSSKEDTNIQLATHALIQMQQRGAALIGLRRMLSSPSESQRLYGLAILETVPAYGLLLDDELVATHPSEREAARARRIMAASGAGTNHRKFLMRGLEEWLAATEPDTGAFELVSSVLTCDVRGTHALCELILERPEAEQIKALGLVRRLCEPGWTYNTLAKIADQTAFGAVVEAARKRSP